MKTDEAFGRAVVLFLCTGNSARGQMAEAFLEAQGTDRFIVRSARLKPKVINPLTVRCMHEIGIDLSAKRSQPVREFLGHMPVRYAISVCTTAERHCPRVWPFGAQFLFWPFRDLASAPGHLELRLVVFRQVRDEIHAKVTAWLQEVERQVEE